MIQPIILKLTTLNLDVFFWLPNREFSLLKHRQKMMIWPDLIPDETAVICCDSADILRKNF